MAQNVLDPEHAVKTEQGTVLQDPPLAQFLFSDTRFAAVWGVVRVLLGLGWINAALPKLTDPAWMQTGEALRGFWTNAIEIPAQGRPPITYDWYRNFIQGMLDSGSYTWFAKLVTFGELFIGVMLIVGAFVGVFAFLGAFMNWNYIMAGSASSNGFFALGAVLLILAWKTAGYYGLDRWILPRIGTTWQSATTERMKFPTRSEYPFKTNPSVKS
jgi:thiosulfate dehydrogenase (quinone) large subunit